METSNIKQIFSQKYIIPCFQREYSWDYDKIKGLIEDIKQIDKEYCLGIITVKNNKKEKLLIDGQQRLVTLYMIAIRCKYITKKTDINISSELNTLLSNNKNDLHYLLEGKEEKVQNNLLSGWKVVDKCIKELEKEKIDIKKSFEKDKITFYEIYLDNSIDINHYFEVLNSRGVQLSRSDIIKSYLMKKFEDDEENQAKLNYMWYIYENMDAKSNSIKEFEKISVKYKRDYKSINKIIDSNQIAKNEKEEKEKNNDNSILDFDYFLLYVIRLYNKKDELPYNFKGEFNLKDMIKEYEDTFKKATKEEVISFLNFMIKIKSIYNSYIIKNKGDKDDWEIAKTNNPKMIMLQACMRVSFTNRKSMHWLFLTLGFFYKNDNINKYIEYMKDYIKNEYIEKYKQEAENLKNEYETGFNTPIIVLNYIDYWMRFNKKKLINIIPEASKIKMENFTFKFRNSIEHFEPRINPETGKPNPSWVNEIGNLALLSYRTNTRMQNDYPKVKAEHFKEEGLDNYSLKLQIMSLITLKRKWEDDETKSLTQKIKMIIEEIIKEN